MSFPGPPGVATAAAGRRPRGAGPTSSTDSVSRSLHASRLGQPVSVRLSGRCPPRMPMQQSRRQSVSQQTVRPAHGPHRPARGASAPTWSELKSRSATPESPRVHGRVVEQRERQARRFQGGPTQTNAGMDAALLRRRCRLDAAAEAVLRLAVDRMSMSARGVNRTLKVFAVRTIAGLGRLDHILPPASRRRSTHPVRTDIHRPGPSYAFSKHGGCLHDERKCRAGGNGRCRLRRGVILLLAVIEQRDHAAPGGPWPRPRTWLVTLRP